MATLHSVEVSLNRLPSRNTSDSAESVARAFVKIDIGDGNFIAHRNIYLIRRDNGGLFLSSPGKRRGDGTYMEFFSVTGPLETEIRNAVVARYRQLIAPAQQATAQATAVTDTVPQAAPSPVGVAERVRRVCAFLEAARAYHQDLSSQGIPVRLLLGTGEVIASDDLLAYVIASTQCSVHVSVVLEINGSNMTLASSDL